MANAGGPDPRTPVVVGVGQVNRPGTDAPEPVDLIAEAARAAGADSGASGLLAAIDSVRIVRILSWRYRDPGLLIAQRIGASPKHTSFSTDGGQTPQMMVNNAASDIRDGKADSVLIAGAESWRTRMAYRSRDEHAPWSPLDESQAPAEVEGKSLDMVSELEREVGVFMPVQIYPMFESALRYEAGRSIADHTRFIAELWSRFSQVAAGNPYAAIRTPQSPEAIATPGPNNRMIGFPYTKMLNSNNSVNQAAVLILCSLEKARALGVPDDRMVFVHAGSEAADTAYVSNRSSMSSSPAIRAAGAAVLDAAGVGVDDIAHVDLYSCFPSAVQVAAKEIGFGLDRQLTVTGGLTFAGGPWNDYVTHSIATMTGVLRADPGAFGYISANGGFLTKHAMGIYSTRPPERPYQVVKPDLGAEGAPREAVDGQATGAATVEAYTVMHDNAGNPERAVLTALLPDGTRTWRTSGDADLMAAMMTEEFCGKPLDLAPDGAVAVA